jgi:hypothetical protein
MTFHQLAHIADVINANSTCYNAIVPYVQNAYMQRRGKTLIPSSCLVLEIMVRGKTKNPIHRTAWKVYEKDIESIIRKLERKDATITTRLEQLALSVHDVEVIVRRATYNTLRLRMVPIGLEILDNLNGG